MSTLFLLCLALLIGGSPLDGQIPPLPHNKVVSWYSYSGDHPIRGRWELHFDGSWRELKRSPWTQWLVRPGVNYQVRPNAELSAAYGYFNTSPGGYGTGLNSFSEHRAQEQLTVRQAIGKLPVRHRIRIDQRFLSSPLEERVSRTWKLQHRARYLFGTDLPLVKTGDKRTALSLGLYDEIMFHFDRSNGAAFEQNRLFAGLRIRPRGSLSLECGAFNQRLRPNGGGPWEKNVVFIIRLISSARLAPLFQRVHH